MMQKKVQIISDGSLDLSQELTKEKDIEVVPFYVSFDSETYQKEMVEVGVREFYQEMVDHPTVFPKTSMPSVHDYYEVFEKHAKEQLPVICICITRKFSGSLQSATTAKDMILEEYPDAQITVIDSTVNTVLQGLYVLEACRLRDMGLEYQQIVDALLPIRETGRIFFTIGSIDYLKHGGRIGRLAGIAASALKIKPLITLKEGEIFNSGITRNRLKSMKKVVDMTREYLDEVNAKPGPPTPATSKTRSRAWPSRRWPARRRTSSWPTLRWWSGSCSIIGRPSTMRRFFWRSSCNTWCIWM